MILLCHGFIICGILNEVFCLFTVKTVVMSGKAPVDTECTSLVGKAHVHYEGNDVYDCMLNQVCCR